jgi:hypothetical protein
MPDHSTSVNPPSSYQFGYDVMGPILAECCLLLHEYLKAAVVPEDSCVLYCARGGLVIKRAMELYLNSTGQELPTCSKDFMVSRLAASRLALQINSDQVAPYLALEFEGKSCAEVATVLAGEFVPDTGEWAKQYDLNHLLQLMSSTQHGLNLRKSIVQQAELLREYFASHVQDKRLVHIVDTGVFGSIGYFLQLGLPDFTLNSVLLFRANYKKNIHIPLPVGTGLVCNEDRYSPWKSRSVSRLYWPLIEAFFEPDLPSVRNYRRDSSDNILSNLQVHNWQDRVCPQPSSVRAGAFDYLASLESSSLPKVSEVASNAWQRLRKQVIYPEKEDLELLGVSKRGLDFGFDEVVTFAEKSHPFHPMKRLAIVRESVWPEGEVRRLFPLMGGFWLTAMELYRFVTAVVRTLKRAMRNQKNYF